MTNPLIQNPGRIRDLSAAMAKGEITAEALVRRYLDRIAAVDGQVKAWIHVLADAALAEARALDAERKAGRLRGPLHGIPVGIKDVIDVRGLPTRASRVQAGSRVARGAQRRARVLEAEARLLRPGQTPLAAARVVARRRRARCFDWPYR